MAERLLEKAGAGGKKKRGKLPATAEEEEGEEEGDEAPAAEGDICFVFYFVFISFFCTVLLSILLS